MILLLSPAKTLDLTELTTSQSSLLLLHHTKNNNNNIIPTPQPNKDLLCTTIPSCNPDLTSDVAKIMKKHASKGKTHLSKLLGVSATIASVACQYWTAFAIEGVQIQKQPAMIGKPAIFTFSGAAYQGLDVNNGLCENRAAMAYLQNSLRIIDPLYGALRPLDVIQPYRLEMATKKIWDLPDCDEDVKVRPKALANYWKDAVTLSLSSSLDSMANDENKSKIVVNLASDEYSAAVDASNLPEGTQYIKCVFRNKGRVIAVHAKKARGMMVRFMAERSIRDIEGIKEFDIDGYKFEESQSSENELVFDRQEQQVIKNKRQSKKDSKPKAKKARTKKS